MGNTLSRDEQAVNGYRGTCDHCRRVFDYPTHLHLRTLCCRHAFCKECLPVDRNANQSVRCPTCFKETIPRLQPSNEDIDITLDFDDGMCPLCQKPHEDKALITCGHVTCSNCLKQWVDDNGLECPVCYIPFEKVSLKKKKPDPRMEEVRIWID